MPAGDPAAYNLATVKRRLSKGQPAYQPRRKANVSPSQQEAVESELEREARNQRSFQPVKHGKSLPKSSLSRRAVRSTVMSNGDNPYKTRRHRGV